MLQAAKALPGGAAPNWAFRAVAGRRVRAIGCCSAGIVIVVPVLCCSFTAPAGGVTLDRLDGAVEYRAADTSDVCTSATRGPWR